MYILSIIDKSFSILTMLDGESADIPSMQLILFNDEEDIEYLKIKVDRGCDFLTSQMFFDNEVFYSFVDRLNSVNINVPVVAGIMPVSNISQLERIVLLSGNNLPKTFMNIVDKYQNDPISFRKASIEFTVKQARDIYANGFNAVHIYSMNKPDVAKEIQNNLWDIS